MTRGGGSCKVRPLERKSGRRGGRGVVGSAWSSRVRSLNVGDGCRAAVLVGGSEKLRDLDDFLPGVEAGRAISSSPRPSMLTPDGPAGSGRHERFEIPDRTVVRY